MNKKEKKAKSLTKTNGKDIVKNTVLALVLYPTRKKQAKSLGIKQDGLRWRLRKYPEIKKEVAKIPSEAMMRLQAGSIRAVEVFLKNLDNSEKDMAAAAEVLNRTGIGVKTPTTQVNVFAQAAKNAEEFVEGEEV